MLNNLFIFSLSFSFVVIDFAVAEAIPVMKVYFIIVVLPFMIQIMIVPWFLQRRKYNIVLILSNI